MQASNPFDIEKLSASGRGYIVPETSWAVVLDIPPDADLTSSKKPMPKSTQKCSKKEEEEKPREEKEVAIKLGDTWGYLAFTPHLMGEFDQLIEIIRSIRDEAFGPRIVGQRRAGLVIGVNAYNDPAGIKLNELKKYCTAVMQLPKACLWTDRPPLDEVAFPVIVVGFLWEATLQYSGTGFGGPRLREGVINFIKQDPERNLPKFRSKVADQKSIPYGSVRSGIMKLEPSNWFVDAFMKSRTALCGQGFFAATIDDDSPNLLVRGLNARHGTHGLVDFQQPVKSHLFDECDALILRRFDHALDSSWPVICGGYEFRFNADPFAPETSVKGYASFLDLLARDILSGFNPKAPYLTEPNTVFFVGADPSFWMVKYGDGDQEGRELQESLAATLPVTFLFDPCLAIATNSKRFGNFGPEKLPLRVAEALKLSPKEDPEFYLLSGLLGGDQSHARFDTLKSRLACCGYTFDSSALEALFSCCMPYFAKSHKDTWRVMRKLYETGIVEKRVAKLSSDIMAWFKEAVELDNSMREESRIFDWRTFPRRLALLKALVAIPYTEVLKAAFGSLHPDLVKDVEICDGMLGRLMRDIGTVSRYFLVAYLKSAADSSAAFVVSLNENLSVKGALKTLAAKATGSSEGSKGEKEEK